MIESLNEQIPTTSYSSNCGCHPT